jgi:hypothetical protein
MQAIIYWVQNQVRNRNHETAGSVLDNGVASCDSTASPKTKLEPAGEKQNLVSPEIISIYRDLKLSACGLRHNT